MTTTGVQTLARFATTVVLGAVAGVTATALAVTGLALPAQARDGADSPHRTLVGHTVQPGDTVTELAVRYHAWTDELIAHNHLGPSGTLRVGDRIEIPVVKQYARPGAGPARKATKASPRPATTTSTRHHGDLSRAKVRRVIAQTAKRHGVDPYLALAVSWQEAGWKMHHVSHADAIGAMQVLPATGRWMSQYAGRPLDLRQVRDNATAGVLLLKLLDRNTSSTRDQVGAYYQGLGAVDRHGLYAETRQYVANVVAIRERLREGWHPET